MSLAGDTVAVAPADLEVDGAALTALNNAAVPAVNDISETDLVRFQRLGSVVGARLGGAPLGLLVLLPSSIPYDSDNYAWFSARYDRFLYVDRIVVSPRAQGAGVGRALYEHAFQAVRAASVPVLLAEVNTRPANPGSLAFHARMGFVPLEERENPISGKRVLMHAWQAHR